jgi:hypothetical protein
MPSGPPRAKLLLFTLLLLAAGAVYLSAATHARLDALERSRQASARVAARWPHMRPRTRAASS